MGIIKAASGAIGGTLANQWLEMFYCDSMPNDVLAKPGDKRINENSSNTKSDPNIISDGSIIVVNDGQCAIVLELGKVIGVYAEPGENTFHSDRTKSIFSGGGIKGIGRQVFDRIGYGGDVAIHQFVIYLDMKEHMGNPFNLSIPFRTKDSNTNLDFDATVNISGMFSFEITEPITFYKKICGNSSATVYKQNILPQLTAELQSIAAIALSALNDNGMRPYEFQSHIDEICSAISSEVTDEWIKLRGFKITSIAIDSFSLTEKDLNSVQNVQHAKMLTDPTMAAAVLTDAQAQAMNKASVNTGGGNVNVFATNNSDNIFLHKDSSKKSLWYCSCGKMNTGNFCEECGAARTKK